MLDQVKGTFNAFLVINWDDSAEITASYDPVALGSAFTVNDNCFYSDLNNDESTFYSKGTVFNLPNPIKAHSHAAFKVQCLPW